MGIPALKLSLSDKPGIIAVLEREGISLTQRSRYFWACCPFHSEKTPSFKVDPDRQTFFCFGCHKKGDAIALVMELHGLSFKEALSYLDIERGRPDPLQISENREKRELTEAFRVWEKNTSDSIALFLRKYRQLRATRTVYTEAELVLLAQLQERFDYLEYIYEEVFCKSNDEAKLTFFKEEYGI
ncbi:MAG: hypothetical protein K8I01_12640 [Candidatus Methylomirabilis sp.]|nr:hypothetical protein [Deltaproteobacteria bacterium]